MRIYLNSAKMKYSISLLLVFISQCISLTLFAFNGQYIISNDIPYYESKERNDSLINIYCNLDIYAPNQGKGHPVIIYFHGGGLTGGSKFIPSEFMDRGIIVVAPNYRLSPMVKCPSYIDDATAAVAWVKKNIYKFGGDPNKIFLSGSSAGAYLSTMICLNKDLLNRYGIDSDSLAGLFSFSGQMTTHYTILHERGLSEGSDTNIIDKYAPLFYARKTIIPMFFFIGDRDQDMAGRFIQNIEMTDTLRNLGNPNISFIEIKNKDHNSMNDSSMLIAFKKIKSFTNYVEDSTENIIQKTANIISIFPNPSTNGSFIILSNDSIFAININNLNGGFLLNKIIFKGTQTVISGLQKGIYLLSIRTKQTYITKKVIIS